MSPSRDDVARQYRIAIHAMIFAAVVVLIGYVIFGLTGFGSALIIVPLLAWQWPLVEVVPLILLLDLAASAQLGHISIAAIRRDELLRVFPGMLVGCVASMYLIFLGSHPLLLLMLGLYIASVGALALIRASKTEVGQLPLRQRPASHAPAAGFIAGLVEGLFGTSGPIIVAWLSSRIDDPQALRVTIAGAIFVAVLATLISMAIGGRLSEPMLWERFALLVGFTLAGGWLGDRVSRRIRGKNIDRLIFGLLLISGLCFAFRAIGLM